MGNHTYQLLGRQNEGIYRGILDQGSKGRRHTAYMYGSHICVLRIYIYICLSTYGLDSFSIASSVPAHHYNRPCLYRVMTSIIPRHSNLRNNNCHGRVAAARWCQKPRSEVESHQRTKRTTPCSNSRLHGLTCFSTTGAPTLQYTIVHGEFAVCRARKIRTRTYNRCRCSLPPSAAKPLPFAPPSLKSIQYVDRKDSKKSAVTSNTTTWRRAERGGEAQKAQEVERLPPL